MPGHMTEVEWRRANLMPISGEEFNIWRNFTMFRLCQLLVVQQWYAQRRSTDRHQAWTYIRISVTTT